MAHLGTFEVVSGKLIVSDPCYDYGENGDAQVLPLNGSLCVENGT